jgi:hypothetical protein
MYCVYVDLYAYVPLYKQTVKVLTLVCHVCFCVTHGGRYSLNDCISVIISRLILHLFQLCVYVRTYVCMYECRYACMYVCMYVVRKDSDL